jgi:hypothetical protein
MRLLVTCVLLCAATAPAFAQPFTNAKASRAGYTATDTAPQKS